MAQVEKFKLWVGIIGGTIGIIAAGIAAGMWIKSCNDREKEYQYCRETINDFKRKYCAVDKFEECVKGLESSKNITCKGNERLVDFDIQKANLFKIVTEFDQYKLLEEENIKKLDDIEQKLLNLKRALAAEPQAELLALEGIITELRGQPQNAMTIFENAAKEKDAPSSIYNYWGYTIKKWGTVGSTAWEKSAIEKYENAIKLSKESTYILPYLNKVDTFLTRARGELELASESQNKNKSLGDAKEYLDNAKKILDEISNIEKSPNAKRELLSGNYYYLLGMYFDLKALNLDAQQQYQQALKRLLDAITLNNKMSDAYFTLGTIYLLLGQFSTAQNYTALASKAFEESFKQSKGQHLAACEALALLSINTQKPDKNRIDMCISIISKQISQFESLRDGTTDETAKTWYQYQIDDLKKRDNEWSKWKKPV